MLYESNFAPHKFYSVYTFCVQYDSNYHHNGKKKNNEGEKIKHKQKVVFAYAWWWWIKGTYILKKREKPEWMKEKISKNWMQ